MHNAKPRCFHVSGKSFTGNEKFQGNICPKPEGSPEDRWFCIMDNVVSPYDLDYMKFFYQFSRMQISQHLYCLYVSTTEFQNME